MMARKKTVTHLKKGNTKKGKNISKEPAMTRLKALMGEMTEEERGRTVDYLKGQDARDKDDAPGGHRIENNCPFDK